MRTASTARRGSRQVGLRFVAALLVLCAVTSAGVAAESTMPAKEWKAIQRVISDQRKALMAGDAVKAFAFAAPGLRDQLGTADAFYAMVRAHYDPIVSARYVAFLDGAVIKSIIIQPLRLVGSDNTVRVALYTMEKQPDGKWRISGCSVAPSALIAT